MKKKLCYFLLLSSVMSFGFESAISLTNTNVVLFKQNENDIRPIASLTKVMNVVVALDMVKNGKIKLSDEVIITKPMTLINESGIDMKVGDRIKLEDLLKAQLVYSANNAAYATAYYISNNNLDKYIELMNKKAKDLEMFSTTFNTPSGLPTRYTRKDLDVSTVNDLVKMTKCALKYPKIIEWVGLKKININGREYITRNKILGKEGNFGLKTGFHNLSGFNMIGINHINGLTLINITLDDKTDREKFNSQLNLTKSFKNLLKKYFFKDQYYDRVEVLNSREKYINTRLASDFYYINNEFKIYENIYELDGNININDKVGEIDIYSLDNELISKIDILASSSAKKLNIFERILRFFKLI